MIDLAELKRLAEAATPGRWHAGHLSDDSHPCGCCYIFGGDYMGAIGEVYVDNGISSVAEGANDCPPLEEAKANQRFIAAANPFTILALIRVAEAAEQTEADRQAMLIALTQREHLSVEQYDAANAAVMRGLYGKAPDGHMHGFATYADNQLLMREKNALIKRLAAAEAALAALGNETDRNAT